MTRLETLIELRDKVKAGECYPKDVLAVFPHYVGDCGQWSHDAYYHGSLDAAKALHEAVLIGHDWLIRNDEIHGGFANVTTHDFAAHVEISGNSSKSYVDSGASFPAYSVNPARAWLLSILEALIAQEPAT